MTRNAERHVHKNSSKTRELLYDDEEKEFFWYDSKSKIFDLERFKSLKNRLKEAKHQQKTSKQQQTTKIERLRANANRK
jgi:hypothetical protein